LIDARLQPVQEIHTDTVAHSQSPNISSMYPTTLQNGNANYAPPVTNGGVSGETNGKLSSPPPSDVPQTEVTSGIPASSSSVPATTSFDSFAPSTTDLETQNTVTTFTTQEPLAQVLEVQPTPDQAATSNMRSSPQPLPQDSETALRIKNDKHQQDLENDIELAQGLSAGGSDPIERTLPPQSAPTAEQQPDLASNMDTSIDAPIDQVPAVADAPVPSPPTAPELAHAILPADQPQAPSPTPPVPQTTDYLHVDQPMMDAPPSPGKVSRERDDEDDEHGPAAKRLKAEKEATEPEFKVPAAPVHSPPSEQRVTEQPAPADDVVTIPRLAHMKKVIANLKKSSISGPFREPVNFVALNIPNYPDIIKQPMDLGTVDRRLKSSSYEKVSDFIADFNLIVNNCATYNGISHSIAQQGLKMRQSFENQMRALPPATFALPAKEEKKTAKPKEHPVRTASQRRPSTSQVVASGSARSPTAPGSAQTFALGPEGVPLIRRDSSAADGRPKRAIHPPKRRDETFGPGRPRKKKFEWQLKFCKEVIHEMKKTKHHSFAQHFYYPVDAVALNIPTYHKVIKKPMDLEQVERKLDSNQYEKAKDFEEDVRQIFKNCYLFNQPGDFVYTAGQQLEKVFEDKWATKDDWLTSHEPASEPQSPGDEDDEDEASEEDEDDSADERNDEISQLKAQIAMMSQTIGNLQAGPKKKKKTTPPAPAPIKKSGKAKKKDKPTSLPASQQQSKEKKKSFSKSKPEKEHFVSYNEKQYISTGISSLPDARMSEALKIIQSNVPSLKNTHETEIELDIDELPNHVLLKLLNFVKKYGENAPPEPEPPQQPAYTPTAAPGKPKKNKPMSKQEQEQQIHELKGKLGAYNGGQISPNPGKSSL
jgi:bromodomain-containing factor 1